MAHDAQKMTIITHAIFAYMLSTGAQAGSESAALCVIGATLPDIDSPRSAIGRTLPFFAIPLNRRFGHRQLIHSFALYLPLLVVGLALNLPTMQWLALGMLSHVLLDCLNTKGVQAFLPFSEKIVVCFKRDWRIHSGSTSEIVLSLVLIGLIAGANYANALGGPRKLINLWLKSPQIMAEEYHRAGNRRCWAQGEFRWKDGRIEPVKWLIVGSEGNTIVDGHSLVLWSGTKLIRAKDGEFLHAILVESQTDWPLIKVNGIVESQTDAFFQSGVRWNVVRAGQKVTGIIKTIQGTFPEVKVCEDKPLSAASSQLLWYQ